MADKKGDHQTLPAVDDGDNCPSHSAPDNKDDNPTHSTPDTRDDNPRYSCQDGKDHNSTSVPDNKEDNPNISSPNGEDDISPYDGSLKADNPTSSAVLDKDNKTSASAPNNLDDKSNEETNNSNAPPRKHFINGVEIRPEGFAKDAVGQVLKVRALQLREDDVLIAAFPKCGTHWVFEIVHMLLNHSVSYSKILKESTMLELVPDLSELDSHPSPRILNTHYFFAHLPDKDILLKKTKIIHIIRNPKDTLVSFYYFMNQFKNFNCTKITFDVFLQKYMTRERRPYHQFDFFRQMQEFEKAHPDHPIIHVHYEDLKLHPLLVLKRLAEFLGVPASEEFYRQVIDACSFQNLKMNDERRQKFYPNIRPHNLKLFRKGIIDDWKNSFTVRQSEEFDEFVANQLRDIKVEFHSPTTNV